MNYKPMIPWMGGKGRLLDRILPKFPAHMCYVEVFCGAAAVFFAKQPSKVEVINDINGELVNLYRVVQYHLEEFVRQFKWALSSRQVFEWEKLKAPETLTDIQRAARFYYMQKLAFGGKVDGQTYGTATTSRPKLNILRIEEELSQAHLRLSGVNVENLAWEECIKRYDRPHTLFYLDPPYWQTAGYGVDFSFENYERMADIAGSVAASVIISINDHPEIRDVFSDFHIESVAIDYTVGGGYGSPAQELIVWNNHCEDRKKLTETMDMFI